MKNYKYFVLIGSFVILTSCSSTQDCNPDQTGFFTGLGCSVGGGYNQRTSNLQGKLQAEQANAAWQQQNARQAQLKADSAKESLLQRRAELLKIDNQALMARRKLETAKANHSLSQKQLYNAQNKLNAYDRKRAQTSSNPSQQDIDALTDILGNM